MIHSFTFKNFCSFAEAATISFVDMRKGIEIKNNMFCNSPSGECLSKVTTLIGPNASGKTSALKALAFLRWFVNDSFVSLKGEEEIPLDAFAFSNDRDSISEFELIFEHKGKVYKYVLHVCKAHVVLEELYSKKQTQHFTYLFRRGWDHENQTTKITQRVPELKTEIVKDVLRKNVSLIAASVAIKNDALIDVSGFWQTIISNVYRMGKSWDTSSLGKDRLFDAATDYQKNQSLFGKAVQFLKDIDLGLDDIRIEEGEARHAKTGEIKKVYLPYGIHKVEGKEYSLPFVFESSGTKNMFVLLNYIFPVIELGGMAVIDELEIDLHPHTLPRIIELFSNRETNPNNSQLLFTSHSLEILNHLEKEQVVLVEKNKDCKSELYRLDSLKGVRRDDNIYAKYMAGAYGAVPNI
jgi:uncharacterized protein